VLALEPVQQREALLDLVEAARGRLDALAVGAQPRGEVVGLDRQRRHAVGQRVQLRVHAAHGLERPRGARDRYGGALVARHRLHAARSGGEQRLEMAQALSLRGERRLLVLARGRVVDLLQLPLEQVQLPVARAGAGLELLHRGAQLPLAPVGRAEGRQPRGMRITAEAVQDLQLRRGQRQLAVLVLAVERQQRTADVAEVGRRGAPTAEVGARAPLGAHAPGQHDLLGILGQALTDQRAQRVGIGEHPLDIGLGGPGTNDPRARLAAQQQVQRVRQHGLAGPRLARQDVEAGPEAQLGPFDEQQVLDAELFQHEGGCTTGVRRSGSPRRRLRRNLRRVVAVRDERRACTEEGRNVPGGPSGICVPSEGTQMPLERRPRSPLPPYMPKPLPMPRAPADALGACKSAASAPAARTAPATGGRSSPPAAAPTPRSPVRTRRGCPPPPAARTPGGRPRGPRRPPPGRRC
jgi:hypothetical protein